MYRNRRNTRNPYTVLILAQLANQVLQLEYKPPVTLALVAANLLIFFGASEFASTGLIPSVWTSCLQPRLILEGRQWRRLFLSAFLHADETHVYYNMSSLVWKGVQLERRYGHLLFAALVLELLALSHGITVLLAALLAANFPEYRYLYRDTCAVGFSAVLFGLKVVLGHDSPGFSQVLGITLPTKYLCWAELLLASYMNPQASFLGHLGGILAGLAHVRLVQPVITRGMMVTRRPGFGWQSWGRAARQRFNGGGRLGGRGGVRADGGRTSGAATRPDPTAGGGSGGGGGDQGRTPAVARGASAYDPSAPEGSGYGFGADPTASGPGSAPFSAQGLSGPAAGVPGAAGGGASGAGGYPRVPTAGLTGAQGQSSGHRGNVLGGSSGEADGNREGRSGAPAQAPSVEELRRRRLERFG